MWNYSNISAETTLTSTVSSGDTAIPIGSTAGLPVSFPYTVVLDFEAASAEVVTVTNLTGSTLTVTRGQDGTTAQAHNLGARVVHAVVARDLREPQEHIAASGDVHGVGGASNIVGTATVQTLTNKTLSGSANTITNIPAANLTGAATDFVTEASGVNAVPLTVQSVDGQVADRQRWENHLGVANTTINAAGELVAGQVRTPGTLNVDGNLTVTGNLTATGDLTGVTVNASEEVISERAGEFDNCYRAAVTADANARLLVRADGFHNWGPGNAAQDTNLYRSAANTLKTDDTFEAAGLTVSGNATVSGTLTVDGVGVAGLPRGILATPVSDSDAVSSAADSVPVRDTQLGNYAFVSPGTGRRLRVVLDGAKVGISIDASVLVAVSIYMVDGTGTPTTGDTLLAEGSARVIDAGGVGQVSLPMSKTFTTAAGDKRVAVFISRAFSTEGAATVSITSGRELYVEDIGPA